MLSKSEVHERAQIIIAAFPEHEILTVADEAILELNKQAMQAVDLQAEVDRLKAIITALESANDELRAMMEGGADNVRL